MRKFAKVHVTLDGFVTEPNSQRLIDEYALAVEPVLLGGGKSLFVKVELRHI